MLTVSRKHLTAALALVGRVAEPKSTLPILARVHCTSEGTGRLRLTCTDLYTSASVDLDVDGTDPVDHALDVRAVVDRLKRFKNGHVALYAPTVGEPDEQGHTDTSDPVRFAEGSRVYSLPWIPGSEFPPTPSDDCAGLLLQCDASILARAIDRVVYAVSDDETRPHLNSVCWEVSEGRLRMVATDGHRLSLHDETVDAWGRGTTSVLVSLSSVAHLRAILGKAPKGAVTVRLASKEGKPWALYVDHGAAKLTARAVDAAFPPYEQVIPAADGMDRHATCSRADLLDALQAVMVSASDRTGCVKVTCTEGAIVLDTESPDEGKAHEEVRAHTLGLSGTPIGFNGRYLLDALKASSAPTVTLSTSGALDPMRIVSDPETVGIIMPLRI